MQCGMDRLGIPEKRWQYRLVVHLADNIAPEAKPVSDAHEVVALFETRESLEAAVDNLLNAGFERADLSVLSSHESLDAAGKPASTVKDALTALVGEIKYEVPLVASGAILIAGGPVAATLASLIGAATAGIAAKEVLDEVTAKPHTEDFARALDAGGVILWARVTNDDQEKNAQNAMHDAGGNNVHIV